MENKISIIIPVYNSEKFLHRCLDSVISQSLNEIEIICIDDGSLDNCPRILDEYAQQDKRIIVIHKENEGQGIARNLALKQANGKYILFLDSDDWLENEALEKMYKKCENDKLDILIFNGWFFNEKSNTKKPYIASQKLYNKFANKVFSADNADENLYTTTIRPLKIYNREFLLSCNFQYSEEKIIEDHFPYFVAFAHAKRISILNEQLYNYTLHDTSTSCSLINKMDMYFDNFYFCYENLSQNPVTQKFFVQFIENKIGNFFYQMQQLPVAYRKLFYKKMKQVIKFILKNKINISVHKRKCQLAKILPYSFFILWTKLKKIFIIMKAQI